MGSRVVDLDLSVTEESACAQGVLPQLTPEDGGYHGLDEKLIYTSPTAKAIHLLACCNWGTLIKNEEWFHWKVRSKAEGHHTMFLKAKIQTFSPQLYQDARYKEAPNTDLRGPFDIKNTVAGIGSSSYIWKIEVKDPHGPLLQEEKLYVMVDWMTKQKVSLPQILSSQLYEKLSFQPKPDLAQEKPVPNDWPLFTMEKVVSSEHIDLNDHISHFCYINFVLENIKLAKDRGAFGEISQLPWAKLYLKRLCAQFKDESRLGDKLLISTWKDDTYPDMAHVSIRKGDTTVFFAEIRFYPDKDIDTELVSKL